eukprot:GHVU01214148.1.p1 GENE.GHVU01214148.1~~GHVU01214148.1.p1  ORF type:complete len:950 (+),score=116.10 GHVU01214148.1:44-2893(+)
MSRTDPKMSSNLVRKPKMKPAGPNRNVYFSRARSTRSNVDKTVMEKGIYANQRLTYVATSMIGCVVQVQVKNGGTYEGIFRTFSPKMEVVLELAHKYDESGASVIPTRERLVDKIIFKLPDIISITASEVDVDFVNKDTFTDGAISKSYNGQTPEKELTPWEGDPSMDVELDTAAESVNNNGWDPNDMFRINRERYHVESSYDPSLKQYTTALKTEDTAEWREKEARAAKLACEIERSEAYKVNAELENGDERDEEEKFSAVVREGGDQETGKKYIPPHMRKGVPRGGMRGVPPARQNSQPSHKAVPQPTPPQWPTPTAYDEAHRVNGDGEKTEGTPEPSNPAESASSPVSVEKEHSASTIRPDNRKSSNPRQEHKTLQDLKTFNEKFKLQVGDSKDKKGEWNSPSPTGPVSTVSVSVTQASPVMQQTPSPAPTLPHSPHQHPTPSHNPHGRPSTSPQLSQSTSPQPKESPLPQDKHTPVMDDHKAHDQDRKEGGVEKVTEMVNKSTLNPNAKEFVFNPNAKPFTPQAPTPPRPHTQSPVVLQPGTMTIQGQPLYPFVVNPQMQQQVVQANQPPRFTPTKRAVVSVQPRPEFTPAAQAAAAATGQPIMAQPATPAQQQYTMQSLQYIPPPGVMGHTAQMPQVYHQMMTMQGQRMAAPANMMVQTSHQSMDQQSMQQNAVFVSPQGPNAGNIPQHYHPHPSGNQHPMAQPAHITPHHHQANPPHSQPSHMTSQTQGGHPSPSPVQHTPSQVAHPHQQHPPSSGTPQPQFIYHTNAGMPHSGQPANHPPLQPSPHTPTSPQTMHPPNMSYTPVYTYTTQAMQANFQQQQSAPQQPHHTTVTHSQHHHSHNSPHVPQIVMMPQPQGHQMQPVPQHHQQLQATPAHLQQHHMQGKYTSNPNAGPHMVHHQSGITVSQANTMHPHLQYVHTQLAAQQGHQAAAQAAAIQFSHNQ